MTAERKLLILGLLRMYDMHGYVLNAHIGLTSPVTLKKPATYNLLDSMERDGWVEHHDESTGDRHRKVYSITPAGGRVFYEQLRTQLGSYSPHESPSVVSLSFYDELPPDEALDLLQQRRDSILEYRASLGTESDSDNSDPHSGSMNLPIKYARRLADLDLTFTDELIEEATKRLHRTKPDER